MKNIENKGVLYVVATPIGNRGDLSPRAKEALLSADIIFAEDTRSLRTLLGEEKPNGTVVRADANMEERAAGSAIAALELGHTICFITDAGTPAISDPGYKLIETVRNALPEVRIVAIPGPSALTAALSISGLPAMPFTFFGFPPMKKGRNTFFETIADLDHTAVLYESPHRILKTLTGLGEVCGESREVFIGRELTKLHEEGFRGTIKKAADYFIEHPDKVRGEFVLVIKGK